MELGMGDGYEEEAGGDGIDEPVQSPGARSPGVAACGLSALMERVDAQLNIGQNFPDDEPSLNSVHHARCHGGPYRVVVVPTATMEEKGVIAAT